MKAGAFDYLLKPVQSERLLTTVKRALDFKELQRENQSLRQRLLSPQLENPEVFKPIITGHPAMHALFRYMEAIALSPKPVLITGETGVGKELAARALHDLSGRPGPFLAANMAGLDDSMFSDTLFGHTQGAFTGAGRQRKGLLAQAGQGTLLLDEVGDLSPQSQVKLLRLLEYGEYYPLGVDTPQHCNARIIASTNRNLDHLQKKGFFRKDLYYRLLTHHLEIPPLRERKEDLPLLLDYFLGKAAHTLGKKRPTTPPELLNLLAAYSFPGNVRELEAMVFDATSGHTSRIMSMDSFKQRIFASLNTEPEPGPQAGDTDGQAIIFPEQLPGLKETSRLLVKEAMQRAENNISIAADMLGISHQALRKRLKKKGSEGV
jgi:DNA-binding NtrC family response regulator